MPLITLADLEREFGPDEIRQVADREGDGLPDATITDNAIAKADGEIESYVRARIVWPPAAPVPRILIDCALDIARYYLYSQAPTELVKERYQMRIAWLRDFAKGLVGLGEEAPAGSAGDVAYSAPERVFSATTLEDYG